MDTYDIPLTIICDLGKNTATPQVISINQNEANIKKLRVEFVSGGKPWEIPTGFSCNILMKKADGFAVDNPAESISGFRFCSANGKRVSCGLVRRHHKFRFL